MSNDQSDTEIRLSADIAATYSTDVDQSLNDTGSEDVDD